jgi:hypothetical protein
MNLRRLMWAHGNHNVLLSHADTGNGVPREFGADRLIEGMSALGQKRTYAVQKGMSALPPKADMCSAVPHVRFGPIADMPARNIRIISDT